MSSFDSFAAMRAAEREEIAKHLDKDDMDGAFARGHRVSCEIQDWFIAEARRCGIQIACEAMIQILSVPIGSITLCTADACDMKVADAFAAISEGLVRTTLSRLNDNRDGSKAISEKL